MKAIIVANHSFRLSSNFELIWADTVSVIRDKIVVNRFLDPILSDANFIFGMLIFALKTSFTEHWVPYLISKFQKFHLFTKLKNDGKENSKFLFWNFDDCCFYYQNLVKYISYNLSEKSMHNAKKYFSLSYCSNYSVVVSKIL